MKLTYRGIAYNSPTLAVVPEVASMIPGIYRGAALTIPRYRVSSPRNTVNLKYRGAYYHPVTYGPDEPIFAPA
jgi:hypothetical protein